MRVRLAQKAKGQALPEYGVLIGLITLAGIGALLSLQTASIDTFTEVLTGLVGAF